MDHDEGDSELVSRALEGSREAAESLVDRHWRSLWRIAHGITRDPAGSEDVVPEALAAAFRRLDRFDPARGSLRVWLSRITVNRALNRRRDHRPVEPLVRDPCPFWPIGRRPRGQLANASQTRPAGGDGGVSDGVRR